MGRSHEDVASALHTFAVAEPAAVSWGHLHSTGTRMWGLSGCRRGTASSWHPLPKEPRASASCTGEAFMSPQPASWLDPHWSQHHSQIPDPQKLCEITQFTMLLIWHYKALGWFLCSNQWPQRCLLNHYLPLWSCGRTQFLSSVRYETQEVLPSRKQLENNRMNYSSFNSLKWPLALMNCYITQTVTLF